MLRLITTEWWLWWQADTKLLPLKMYFSCHVMPKAVILKGTTGCPASLRNVDRFRFHGFGRLHHPANGCYKKSGFDLNHILSPFITERFHGYLGQEATRSDRRQHRPTEKNEPMSTKSFACRTTTVALGYNFTTRFRGF